MGESRRYIMNKKNGFNVMVNMYIIRYLYSHIEKSSRFMDSENKKKKSIDFYENVIHISKPRMIRMLHGMDFEVSANERKELCRIFYIKEDYFLKNGLFMEVHLLDEIDWKCFFNEKYDTLFQLNLSNRVKQEKIKKVKENLKYLVKKDVIENEYEHDSPIYRIYHYFHKGNIYKEESRLTRFLRELSNLQLSDWEDIEMDIVELNKYQKMMAEHTNYITVITDYHNLKAGHKNM